MTLLVVFLTAIYACYLIWPPLPLVLIVALVIWFVLRRVQARRPAPVPSAIDSRYIPDQVRREVLERDHYRCRICGSNSYLELDHVIPLSKGGSTSPNNLQVLCRQHNLEKGNR